jgi:hypothetical protein
MLLQCLLRHATQGVLGGVIQDATRFLSQKIEKKVKRELEQLAAHEQAIC